MRENKDKKINQEELTSLRLLEAVNQPGWGTFQCKPPIAALQWGSGAIQNNAGKPRSGQGRRHAVLVSPLGSAQSPKRNLQLAASLQPTEEGVRFSAGLGRCLGSASVRALPARSAAGPSLRIVFSCAKGLAGFNGEVNVWEESRSRPDAGRRSSSSRDPGHPGPWENVTV